MRTLLLAVLLGTALPPAAQSALDETIPQPGDVTIGPYEEEPHFLLMRWTTLEGAKYYRVWREVVVALDLDDEGGVVELAEPKSAWIPATSAAWSAPPGRNGGGRAAPAWSTWTGSCAGRPGAG